MNQRFHLLWILGLILMPIASASGLDYLDEFNLEGETCKILDEHFAYFLADGTESLAVFYECCKGDSCIKLPFDLVSEYPYPENDNAELFNSLHVLNSIKEGEISENIFSYKEYFDLCDYFGSDKLAEQSISLSSEGYEVVKSGLSKEQRAVASGIKDFLKGINFIKKFNPVELGGSAVCYKIDGAERKAFEQLLVCNENLKILASEVSYKGIISSMKNCNAKARAEIAGVIDSPVQKGKHLVTKTGNAVAEVGDWLSNIGDKDNSFDVKDTPYEQLEKSLDKISKENPLLSDPNSQKLALQALDRFQKKNDEVQQKVSIINAKVSNISSIKPNPIVVFFKNIFLKPNYNKTRIEEQKAIASSKITGFDTLYNSAKYNSALESSQGAIESLDNYYDAVNSENNIERKFDRKWYIVPATFIIVLGFIFYRNYKQ